VAFDKRNGKLLWGSRCKDPAGHNAGPTPLTVRDIPCLAVLTREGLHVARIDKDHLGKTVATYSWVTDYNNNIVGASASADKVVITSGYNQNRIALFELNLNGIAKIHEVKRDCSKVGTPIIYKNHLYIPYEQLRCYRIDRNGLTLGWKGARDKFGFGLDGSAVVTGDGRLIVFGSKGSKHRLALIDIGRSQPSLLSSDEDVFAGLKRGRARAWPHVVLANGRIYCKDLDGNLVCFALNRQGGKS
jgi:hypothetical protein